MGNNNNACPLTHGRRAVSYRIIVQSLRLPVHDIILYLYNDNAYHNVITIIINTKKTQKVPRSIVPVRGGVRGSGGGGNHFSGDVRAHPYRARRRLPDTRDPNTVVAAAAVQCLRRHSYGARQHRSVAVATPSARLVDTRACSSVRAFLELAKTVYTAEPSPIGRPISRQSVPVLRQSYPTARVARLPRYLSLSQSSGMDRETIVFCSCRPSRSSSSSSDRRC